MIKRFLGLSMLFACAVSQPATAQDGQSPTETDPASGSQEATEMAQPDDANEIVIEADREARRDILRKQVSGITRPPRFDRPMGRFMLPPCPKVYGLKREFAQIIEARFRDNLASTGIIAARKDCVANVYILFVKDLDNGLRQAAEETAIFKQLLSYQQDRVLDEEGPVRAWNLSEVRDEDGNPFAYDPKTRMHNNRPNIASRLRLPITVEIVGSVVAIDVSALPGKSLYQLADYATVRGLADVDPARREEGSPLDSILTLFDEDAYPPEELTLFDRAYLKTLYGFPTEVSAPQMYSQIAMIAERMERQEEETETGE